MAIIIPQWFYGLDSLASIVSALIGFLVSFKFFQLHEMTKRKNHLYLHYGFALLSMSFLLMGTVSGYSYLRHLFPSPTDVHVLGLFDEVVSIEDVAMWIYFFATTVAYLAFLLAYKPREEGGLLSPAILPVWMVGYKSFHMLSMFILAYVVFRAAINYRLHKSRKSGLVLFAFSSLWLHHLFLFLTSFSGTAYVIAHLLMIAGFTAFWVMLRSVQRG